MQTFDVEDRWPELFVQLDDVQRNAVRQSLASAWHEGWEPNREDVENLTDEARGAIDGEEYMRRVRQAVEERPTVQKSFIEAGFDGAGRSVGKGLIDDLECLPPPTGIEEGEHANVRMQQDRAVVQQGQRFVERLLAGGQRRRGVAAAEADEGTDEATAPVDDVQARRGDTLGPCVGFVEMTRDQIGVRVGCDQQIRPWYREGLLVTLSKRSVTGCGPTMMSSKKILRVSVHSVYRLRKFARSGPSAATDGHSYRTV